MKSWGWSHHDGISALIRKDTRGTSLAVQWLRLHTSSAGGMGSIPGRGTKIPHAVQGGQKKKKTQESLYQGKANLPHELGKATYWTCKIPCIQVYTQWCTCCIHSYSRRVQVPLKRFLKRLLEQLILPTIYLTMLKIVFWLLSHLKLANSGLISK